MRLLFLSFTRAFCSATNRRKTSSLVVSLLTNCRLQCGTEAADPPGRAGLLSRRGYCHATPHPPREVRTSLFSPPFYLRGVRGIATRFQAKTAALVCHYLRRQVRSFASSFAPLPPCVLSPSFKMDLAAIDCGTEACEGVT